jgi:Protein of unknown function (DUF3761)
MSTKLRGVTATVLLGLLVLGGPTSPAVSSVELFAHSCKSGSYLNAKGVCTKSPSKSPSWPSGATAKCRDGTYSFSQSRRGTCSHHGGVSIWR